MEKYFKLILPKLLSYSYVGRVRSINTQHIAFFNQNDEVMMVYNPQTYTMFIKTDYIITLRHILGLDKIKKHNGGIHNYFVNNFPNLVIDKWYSTIYLNSDSSIR
jgi:hypothetical protein